MPWQQYIYKSVQLFSEKQTHLPAMIKGTEIRIYQNNKN